MGQAVEALHQIPFEYPGSTGAIGPRQVSKRVQGTPARSEPIGALTEEGFIEGCEHLSHCRLHDTIPQGRNAEPALLVLPLGDVDPPGRLWPIAVLHQLLG